MQPLNNIFCIQASIKYCNNPVQFSDFSDDESVEYHKSNYSCLVEVNNKKQKKEYLNSLILSYDCYQKLLVDEIVKLKPEVAETFINLLSNKIIKLYLEDDKPRDQIHLIATINNFQVTRAEAYKNEYENVIILVEKLSKNFENSNNPNEFKSILIEILKDTNFQESHSLILKIIKTLQKKFGNLEYLEYLADSMDDMRVEFFFAEKYKPISNQQKKKMQAEHLPWNFGNNDLNNFGKEKFKSQIEEKKMEADDACQLVNAVKCSQKSDSSLNSIVEHMNQLWYFLFLIEKRKILEKELAPYKQVIEASRKSDLKKEYNQKEILKMNYEQIIYPNHKIMQNKNTLCFESFYKIYSAYLKVNQEKNILTEKSTPILKDQNYVSSDNQFKSHNLIVNYFTNSQYKDFYPEDKLVKSIQETVDSRDLLQNNIVKKTLQFLNYRKMNQALEYTRDTIRNIKKQDKHLHESHSLVLQKSDLQFSSPEQQQQKSEQNIQIDKFDL